jgi:hypothetical protein
MGFPFGECINVEFRLIRIAGLGEIVIVKG